MDRPSPLVVRTVRVLAGTVLLLAGVAGLFLPIVPGWLLIIPGLAVLARDFSWAQRLLDGARNRWATTRSVVERRIDDDEEPPGEPA